MKQIPFNKPCFAGKELEYIAQAVRSGKISGNGDFTKSCQSLIEKKFNVKKVLLTNSCTSAMEMAAILINLKPNDEVILPSFTFVSTANAFVLRGARPNFVDIREDTLNLDETRLSEKMNRKTKAIFAVHYAGVGCEMDDINQFAKQKKLFVVEDAAQAIDAYYKNKPLGTLGDFGAYSFHETKNCISGEGGALLINRNQYVERAEIIWEKGTDRCQFFRGEVDKYTWQDVGSSFLPSELVSAFLYAQLEHLNEIERKRKRIYHFYEERLRPLQKNGDLRLPYIPDHCKTNHHMFYLLLPSGKERNRVMTKLKKAGVLAIFHYIPLHLSPMGRRFGYKKGDFPISEEMSDRLLRLPFYNDLDERAQDSIVKFVQENL